MQVISWSVTAVERKQVLGVGMLLSRSWSPFPVIQPQVVQYTKFVILVLLFFSLRKNFWVDLFKDLYSVSFACLG